MSSIQQRFYSSWGLAAAGFLLTLALASVITSAQRVVTAPPPPAIKNFGKVRLRWNF